MSMREILRSANATRMRALISWSSGKDCAWALHLLQGREDIEVVGLLTTLNEAFDRVAMHAVRRPLVEAQVRAVGLPLWQPEGGTQTLAREMVSSGVEARITCVDPRQLDPSFVGRRFDSAFLDDLPPEVDPCGERGEFHTFCYAGPAFDEPVSVEAGELVERDGFWFADLLPR